MSTRSVLRAALAIAASLLPTAAWAHTGHGATVGFLQGFVHPVTGLDHVLAMVAVGLFAANLGGRALWAVPLSFVSVMAVGGALGVAGIGVPFVEAGIAMSVIVLGLAVALQWKWPVAAAIGLVGIFAIFHGHAHGAEMPVDASGLEYGLGFMLATALLHAAGIGLGLGIARFGRAAAPRAIQFGGVALAVAGLGILTGII
ncbi:HupE/UreJ family protein [Dongia sedimenti]|uniref:HupE/UreJ family protein n=1 Tax=Dongia sedimenti TaxID=3064282 RepID=A0ABU0YKB4_9PROT|nr:HupE/UreJ family protein [Rhodospirillaceae bacterium R-7]